jgi:hypothetical protein
MRADCLALCLRLFCKQSDRQGALHCAPESTLNLERAGGWAFNSGFVTVLPSPESALTCGGWVVEQNPAGLERTSLAQSGLFRSAPNILPNVDLPPDPGQGSGPTKHPETLLYNPSSGGPLPQGKTQAYSEVMSKEKKRKGDRFIFDCLRGCIHFQPWN